MIRLIYWHKYKYIKIHFIKVFDDFFIATEIFLSRLPNAPSSGHV